MNPSSTSSSGVYLAYSPNDFFWSSAHFTESDMKHCDDPALIDLKCSKPNSDRTQSLCDYRDVCQNYEKSRTLHGLQTQHSGADTRLYDAQQKYYQHLRMALNHGLGIVGVLGLIYYFRNRGAATAAAMVLK